MKKRVRRSLWIPAAAVSVLILAAAVGFGQQPSPGEKLYRDYCAICHGENGEGRGIAAPSMDRKLNDFRNPDFWADRSDRRMMQAILKGKGRMPAQPLSDDEAKAVLEYMKGFKGRYGS